VTRATSELVAAADLLVVGSPTHMHGMSSAASRRSAAETARKQGSGLAMDPDADGPGVRGWLDGISFLVSRQSARLDGETARARCWGAQIGEEARSVFAHA